MTTGASPRDRAATYLPWRIRGSLHGVTVRPRWIDGADRFWYRVTDPDGARFVLVDPDSGHRGPAFDHLRLAAALSRAAGVDVEAAALPFTTITVTGAAVEFTALDRQWRFDTDTGECVEVPAGDPARRYSPSGAHSVFVRDGDLWLHETATGTTTRLTEDGRPGRDYATALPSPLPALGVRRANPWPKPGPMALWSPDGRRLLTHRIDSRGTARYTLTRSAPGGDSPLPRSAEYAHPVPGGTAARVDLLLFDVETGRRTEVQVPGPDQLYLGSPLRPDGPIWWSPDGSRCYLLRAERGGLTLRLYEIDASTGTARILVAETDDVPVDIGPSPAARPHARVLADGERVLWLSQRDGWAHLYLYRNGRARRLTGGDWVVVEVVAVDEDAQTVYFTAVGREPGRDPYERLLYRVELSGGDPELLTPGPGSHTVSLSRSLRWCVSTRSRMDTPPVTELFDLRRGTRRVLETADLSALTERGWAFPERFTTVARDGVTELRGVLIRPGNFDPDRSYPVIDAVYGAPGLNRAPVSLAEAGDSFWHAQALAELGFAVVMVDGLGTPHRSKAFRRVSYRNLGDAGLPDHLAVLRQLGATRSWLDLDRVGVYGHSAGGYTACRAMFVHGDVYRVGVASSGNHDHRIDKAAWVERLQGLPVGEHYAEQANAAHAAGLRGRLLLAHGELDDNVHPAATLAVAEALIAAGKDFELLMLPERGHDLGSDEYFVRRRWDFFVRHLSGADDAPDRPCGG